ncbi:STAS/SEC14 domain-containing protein [uncultured Tateyamaria sp.]|uniref:STAS/SEC14 domain-containing protein n=1 Tax=uncultured Tateyamaria sp. TaxID=455651 RepID=UPI0026196EF5|nr:STAS/SEC14 domain-containing protein [uncultured Tateyamaria sp.]
MLDTPSITQVNTSRPDLYAFRITRMVTQEDMEAMAALMNDAFDAHEDKVDLLMIFDRYDGAESGATWSWEALKSRFKSITNVRRYVVVGAPDSAEQLIEAMGKVIPVEAETHDTEIAAWRSLNAEAVAA